MYDIIILGAGAAGLTAAMYGARGGYNVVVLEKELAGGQTATTFEIDNYPGVETTGGFELMQIMINQVNKLGVKIEYGNIDIVSLSDTVKKIKLNDTIIEGKTVVLAMGAKPRQLGIENETKLRGKGVSYCATCDGNFFRGKDVAVVGGGNTAVEDAIYLSNIVNKCYIIHRRDTFRASKILVDKLLNTENITFIKDSQIKNIIGDEKLEKIEIIDNDKNISEIKTDALFVAVGNIPNSSDVDIVKDENGYIIANHKMETSFEGVFTCGDIRNTPLRQVITAAGDGAIAANTAIEYLMKN